MFTVNPITYLISIPQSYLTFDSGSLYRLDTNKFRKDLKEYEASFEGIVQTKTHDHVTEITIVGTTYARFIVILAPYSIEFEDGPYSVILDGSNNNIWDIQSGILERNQVQVIPTNSAGNTVTTTGSGVTPADISAITAGVWEELGGSHINPLTFGFIVQEIEQYVKKSSDNAEQANLKL